MQLATVKYQHKYFCRRGVVTIIDRMTESVLAYVLCSIAYVFSRNINDGVINTSLSVYKFIGKFIIIVGRIDIEQKISVRNKFMHSDCLVHIHRLSHHLACNSSIQLLPKR